MAWRMSVGVARTTSQSVFDFDVRHSRAVTHARWRGSVQVRTGGDPTQGLCSESR